MKPGHFVVTNVVSKF